MSENDQTMRGKICMVTGATSGIGKVAARVLAEKGAHVVVVGRNERKTAATVAMIKRRANHDNVTYMLADFASQEATRRLAAEYQATYDRLDVLVNNAGAFFMRRQETKDGIEMTFAVNHLGYFLLTNLLLDVIKASAPARIVNVASSAHWRARLDFDDLMTREGYRGMKAYGRSKLANIYFTYELARRLEGSGITVNTLHPGFVATNLGANNIPLIGGLVKRIINLSAIDVEQGAQTIIYLASSPEVEGVTGKYFVDCKAVEPSEVSYDEEAARRLWQISAQMVGLAG